MKLFRLYILCIVIFNGLFAFSCKEGEITPIDYRDKYVGTYKGVSMNITILTASSGTTRDTTIDNNATIVFTKVGDYPSKSISMDGGNGFVLSNSNMNDVGGMSDGSFVSFNYPSVHVYGQAGPSGWQQYKWDFKGVKQQ